jgi:hypothetical protein
MISRVEIQSDSVVIRELPSMAVKIVAMDQWLLAKCRVHLDSIFRRPTLPVIYVRTNLITQKADREVCRGISHPHTLITSSTIICVLRATDHRKSIFRVFELDLQVQVPASAIRELERITITLYSSAGPANRISASTAL